MYLLPKNNNIIIHDLNILLYINTNKNTTTTTTTTYHIYKLNVIRNCR